MTNNDNRLYANTRRLLHSLPVPPFAGPMMDEAYWERAEAENLEAMAERGGYSL